MPSKLLRLLDRYTYVEDCQDKVIALFEAERKEVKRLTTITLMDGRVLDKHSAERKATTEVIEAAKTLRGKLVCLGGYPALQTEIERFNRKLEAYEDD